MPPTCCLIALGIAFSTACGFPRPPDIGDDALGSDTVYVSPSGDDANDGIILPVKTIKHAIGISRADARITNIVLASGSYSLSSGETFPYTVPAGVTIAGPAGGGAILAGSKAEPGMSIDSGVLQDIELQDFTVAVTAIGTARLKNIRVRASALAVQAETTAKLTADHLDIAGIPSACGPGIVLLGSAMFMATTLTTRNLGTTLEARDQSETHIANASISGDRSCSQNPGVIVITSNRSLVLGDSLLDGGNRGILLLPRSSSPSSLQVTISDTTIRNNRGNALAGGAPPGGSLSFQMIGGALSNNASSGADVGEGTWRFTNVTVQQSGGVAIYVQDGKLIMRGCPITGVIDVFDNATADLGTIANPGNNSILATTGAGLTLDGNFGATLVEAVGNSWKPDIQGADATGRYATPATIAGPVPAVDGNNFAINSGWSLLR